VEDPDIRATMTGFNDHVYFKDEDVELFFEGNGYYYELGLNALNTSYQIRWTWVEPLVREQRFSELEELFKAPDVLYYVARDGQKIGRHADLNYQLPGCKHAVFIDGTINCPDVKDRGWTVEVALPWEGLRQIAGGGRTTRSLTLQVAVGNGRYYGGGNVIEKSATIIDESLRLYSLEFVQAWRVVLMFRSFRSGEHGALNEVLTLRGDKFEIRTRRPRPVNADGEIVTRTPAVFRVLPKAIDVIVP